MGQVIISKEHLRVTGFDREPLANEMALNEVDRLSELTKTVEIPVKVSKVDEEGLPYFYFDTPETESEVETDITVETIEETDDPVMVMVSKRIPLLGEDGEQMEYETTYLQVTPAEYDEEGELVTEEKEELIPSGVFLKCYTVEEVEEQKKDDEGRPLFYGTEKVTETVTEPGERIEILQTDERYEEGLTEVLEDLEPKRVEVSILENPDLFELEDILQHKYLGVLNPTQFDELIVGTFLLGDEIDLGYENHNGHIGFGLVSLPPGGEVQTKVYEFVEGRKEFHLLQFDGDSDVSVKVNGQTFTDGKLTLASPVTELRLSFKNTSDRVKDIRSFAVGY